ncbi:MAG: hypothetical protein Q7T60_17135 [Sphingopyxis sp.]|nr:hypothetical protein [Sphingopyxis sp.]
MTDASPPAAPGMPEEETIARALHAAWYHAGRQIPPGFPGDYLDPKNRFSDQGVAYERLLSQARAILSLIRPALEAKDAEIGFLRAGLKREREAHRETIRQMAAINAALEAKLAQAVEALSRAKDEIVRTADDLSMHSPAVKMIEEIASITGQPALSSRAIVRTAASAIRGEKT